MLSTGKMTAPNVAGYALETVSGLVALWEATADSVTYNLGENLIAYSTDTSGWNLFVRATAADGFTDPNGGSNAVRITEDSSASTTHYARVEATSVTSGVEQKFILDIKPNGRTKIQLKAWSSNGWSGTVYAQYDLSGDGAVNFDNTGGATIEAINNGFYQCTFLHDSAATSTDVDIMLVDDSYNDSYTGDGSSGVYAYNPQLAQTSRIGERVETDTTIEILNAVSQWNDKSGNDYHLASEADGDDILWNSAGYLDFQVGKVLRNSDAGLENALSIAQEKTIFILCDTDTSATDQRSLLGVYKASNDRLAIAHRSGLFRVGHYDGSSYVDPVSYTESAPTGKSMATITFDGASDTTLTVNDNASDGTGAPYAGSLGDVTVGGRTGGSATSATLPYDGKIYAFAVYNRILSSGEIDQVEEYLTTKFA